MLDYTKLLMAQMELVCGMGSSRSRYSLTQEQRFLNTVAYIP